MERLDVALVKRGYFESRESAKRAILAHQIYDETDRLYSKPSMQVEGRIKFVIKGELCPYVSRGGYKLEKAIKEFNLNLNGKAMLDIGASTGGFTDCALQNGARKVYCIDVGHSQLHRKLRNNGNIINKENTNFRELTKKDLNDNINFASMDVSFTSATLLIPNLAKLLDSNSYAVILVKPQFEAGPKNIGKNGVVKDPKVHQETIEKVASCAIANHFSCVDLTFSPIKGEKEGNIEYLLLLKLDNKKDDLPKGKVESVVTKAFATLK